jgi:hypothetical protein
MLKNGQTTQTDLKGLKELLPIVEGIDAFNMQLPFPGRLHILPNACSKILRLACPGTGPKITLVCE